MIKTKMKELRIINKFANEDIINIHSTDILPVTKNLDNDIMVSNNNPVFPMNTGDFNGKAIYLGTVSSNIIWKLGKTKEGYIVAVPMVKR